MEPFVGDFKVVEVAWPDGAGEKQDDQNLHWHSVLMTEDRMNDLLMRLIGECVRNFFYMNTILTTVHM